MKFTKGPLTVGMNEMSADEMKERLAKTIDGSVDRGDSVGELWSVFVGSADSPLMCCYTGNGPTSEANAYLFAAAPELFEACQDALSTFKRQLDSEEKGIGFCGDDEHESIRLLEEALAKARGWGSDGEGN